MVEASLLDYTLSLAIQKVKFFPVIPNTKLPAVDDPKNHATSKADELKKMFQGNKNLNSGIACGFVDENLYLVGFDIDDKDGRKGFETLRLLESEGRIFPHTWSQRTPSGGEHRLYWSPIPIKQGTNVAGPGIDFRSDGGYLVGPGSRIDGKAYTPLNNKSIVLFPDWAVEAFKKSDKVVSITASPNYKPVENQVLALKQSVDYLNGLPLVMTGSRNDSGYKVVCKLKDFGLAHDQMTEVLQEYWKCEPMLEVSELSHLINSAFRYGGNTAGVMAPESMFDDLPVEEKPKGPLKDEPVHPFLELNKDHFYVASDGVSRVCWETEKYGEFHLERFPVHQFHEKNSHNVMQFGKGLQPVTQLWIKDPSRRTYDFIHFDPTERVLPRFYNLWKGFRVKRPGAKKIFVESAHKAVDMFLEHCLKNVCDNDAALNDWLITFFAHMFQKPGEKPLVALVFKGRKGIGKSALIDRLSFMIGKHAVTVADRTHLTNHFNSIMEDKILFVLDEALWAGDKSSEGILKHVITGKKRVITHKGAAPYEASVYDRIAIIGNEDWLVPATNDERRFAVFNVGEGRKGDSRFFVDMRKGLEEKGGAELLMEYFMTWDLDTADVDVAPDTEGLKEQKDISLGAFEMWWKSCLQEERLIGSGFDEWPSCIKTRELFESFTRTMEKDRIKTFIPNVYAVGKIFSRVAPSCSKTVVKKRGGELSYRQYDFVPIEIAQLEWDQYIGHKGNWG